MKKRRTKKNKVNPPEVMPEAAYNISPDDIEIGDEIITLKEIKKKEKEKKGEDH